jgi:hypothetical protein
VDAPEARPGQPFQQASEANKLVIARRIDPCMSEVYS